MSIFVESKIKKIYGGTAKVKKAFWGSAQIWVSTVQISVPTVSGTYTYNGSSQTVQWSGYDSTKMTLGGTTSATSAGTYSATFTPKEGYSWDAEGDDTAARTVTWTIARKSISGATITLSNSLTYTGSTLTQGISSVVISGLSATYSVTGNTGTNAGSYTLTCTGTGNFTGTQTKAWSIAKAAVTITTSVSSISIAAGTATSSFTFSRTGNGAITVTSSDASVATISGNTSPVTVTKQGAGSCTITINVAAGTNHLAGSKTISCSCAYAVMAVSGIDNLSTARGCTISGEINGNLLFMGGKISGTYKASTNIDIYNQSLTHSTSSLTFRKSSFHSWGAKARTWNNGTYLMLAPQVTSNASQGNMILDYWNASMTYGYVATSTHGWQGGPSESCGVGNKVLSYTASTTSSTYYMYVMDNSFTLSTWYEQYISSSVALNVPVPIGEKAIFHHGTDLYWCDSQGTISLFYENANSSSYIDATTFNGYGIFNVTSGTSNIDVCDSDLTVSNVNMSSIFYGTYTPSFANVNDKKVLNLGRNATTGVNFLETFDEGFVRGAMALPSRDNYAYQGMSGGSVGKYGLFAGGCTIYDEVDYSYNTVNAYGYI